MPPFRPCLQRTQKALLTRSLTTSQFDPNLPNPPPPLDPKMLHLTPSTLSLFQSRLAHHLETTSPISWTYKGPPGTTFRHAGILVPLCVAHGAPSLLFTVRNSKLRRHGGEVSFPGGSRDPTDRTLIDTALRETHEEVLIPPCNVTTLGTFHPLPDRSHTLLIHPVLGYIHTPHMLDPKSMPFNQSEVAKIFTVPIEQLLCMQTTVEKFRGGGRDVRNWDIDGHRIWGLTAWIMELLFGVVIAPGGVIGCERIVDSGKLLVPDVGEGIVNR